MAYWENTAKGRGDVLSPASKPTAPNGDSSNQTQFTGDGSYTVPVANGSDLDAGNVVQVTTNTKDTGTVKNALNSYQKSLLSADSNPDRGTDRSGNRVAKKATDRQTI